VRFIPSGRVHYFDPSDHDISIGDRVIVETDLGAREAVVVITPDQVLLSELRGPVPMIVGKAGD